ncbi:hypothetical protein F5Y04DRAFT_277439 [Hypomontagnella monticulosa]|nr:hypothetical protein F5Y04DRAFT_277439 [Hypomontagnella monticulosa]
MPQMTSINNDVLSTGKGQIRPPYSPCNDGQGELTIVHYRGPNMKNPRSELKHDENGALQGSFRTFGASERIRSNLDAGSRSTTAITRVFGACKRCQKQKSRCNMSRDEYTPCETCSKTPPEVLKAPCIRVSILDLNLHRRGSTLNNDLETWTSTQESLLINVALYNNEVPETRIVSITQDQGIDIPVTVRRFIPLPESTTGWKWRDGACDERVLDMPCFYISDEEEAAGNMIKAAVSNKWQYITCLLDAANPIIKKTFEAAFRYLETSNSLLVQNCLTFWTATRFIEKPWRICSDGGLPGFEPSYEVDCPFSGIVPVTPIMDTQIDDLAIKRLLMPLGELILKELDRKIHERKRENWFDIYLSTFIIMNNFEFVFSDVIDYTSRHGLKPSTTGASSLSKRYFHACKTILAYFRFACNGHAPLSLSWNNMSASVDGLTFDQEGYIRDIKMEIDRQAESLSTWRKGSVYRTPLYLCYQVLAENWSPDVSNSEPLDNFTEEDFLAS